MKDSLRENLGFIYKIKYIGKSTDILSQGKTYWHNGCDVDPYRDGVDYYHILNDKDEGCWVETTEFVRG